MRPFKDHYVTKYGHSVVTSYIKSTVKSAQIFSEVIKKAGSILSLRQENINTISMKVQHPEYNIWKLERMMLEDGFYFYSAKLSISPFYSHKMAFLEAFSNSMFR